MVFPLEQWLSAVLLLEAFPLSKVDRSKQTLKCDLNYSVLEESSTVKIVTRSYSLI